MQSKSSNTEPYRRNEKDVLFLSVGSIIQRNNLKSISGHVFLYIKRNIFAVFDQIMCLYIRYISYKGAFTMVNAIVYL